MSERLRKNLLKYGISAVVCASFAVFFCSVRDFGQMELLERYRTLCDAFTIPGVICLCLGALLWVSNDGFFYGLGYCLETARRALIPGSKQKTETFYDYIQRKRGKKVMGYSFLFAVGGACMMIALVFMALFFKLY